MNEQQIDTGGAAEPSGTLATQLQKRMDGKVEVTSALRAVHLRPDPNGSVMVDTPVVREAFSFELSFKERVLRAIFGKRVMVDDTIQVPHSVVKDYGVVGRRMVTTAGVTAIANAFLNTFEPETFNFHASGTGAGAEAIGQTALVTETGTRVAGTQSSPSAGVYRSVATIAYTGALAIIEHGLFSAATVGTLLDRTLFTAINVANGDSIQFTYDLTFTAGG